MVTGWSQIDVRVCEGLSILWMGAGKLSVAIQRIDKCITRGIRGHVLNDKNWRGKVLR